MRAPQKRRSDSSGRRKGQAAGRRAPRGQPPWPPHLLPLRRHRTVVVLVHGITSTSETWAKVFPYLAEHCTVIAPDLLGHGESAKPRGDYSLGAYASGIRDLLVALGHDRATFPSAASAWQWSTAVGWDERSAGCCGWPACRARNSSCPCWSTGGCWRRARGRARRAAADRTIIDPLGQRVDARDRLYLAQGLPFLIIWGERDPIIPLAHGQAAHDLVSGSRLEIFPGTGHFPHLEDPQRSSGCSSTSRDRRRRQSSNPAASVSSCARAERRAGAGAVQADEGTGTATRSASSTIRVA